MHCMRHYTSTSIRTNYPMASSLLLRHPPFRANDGFFAVVAPFLPNTPQIKHLPFGEPLLPFLLQYFLVRVRCRCRQHHRFPGWLHFPQKTGLGFDGKKNFATDSIRLVSRTLLAMLCQDRLGSFLLHGAPPERTACVAWAICQAMTGGTAFPTCRSVSRSFAAKLKLSGND